MADVQSNTSKEHEPGSEINTSTFELLEIDPDALEETHEALNAFIKKADNMEAAADTFYMAFYDSIPSMHHSFNTAKAVVAMRFLQAFDALFEAAVSSKTLKAMAEALGYQHIHLDVTVARVIAVRDAILECLQLSMGPQSQAVRESVHALIEYVGGSIICVRTHYQERLRMLVESWELATNEHDGYDMDGSESGKDGTSSKGGASGEKHMNDTGSNNGEQMPTSFADMFQINSAVMGFHDCEWMTPVIDALTTIIPNVGNASRVQEECDVLVLKLSMYEPEVLKLADFKACLLAALRSLLRTQWNTHYEVAWTWLWDTVSQILNVSLAKPATYEEALEAMMDSLDGESLFEMRKSVYTRFFELAPIGQNYFKQSNTRLHFIVSRINQMTLELYQTPKRLVSEISALGLRHVGFGIPTELFSPFVTSCVEVYRAAADDDVAVESFRWSLALIAKILVRTIHEGSTVVIKAINADSTKELKKAIAGAPRRMRALWLLSIQVGGQHISPLSWSIESGSMEVARAILKDLLTIRADRARYYYGVVELFKQHPDIIKRLCQEAPTLLPTLLEGLVWRSHRATNGLRRVNYFVEHMLLDGTGSFADGLHWIVADGDPAVISHPVIVTVSDTLWNGVVYKQFIYAKMWNLVSLLVFSAQAILSTTYTNPDGGINYGIFACRLFTYVFGMGRQGYGLFHKGWVWARKELKRIFAEIDEDGNGSIDWEEFIQAMTTFRQSIEDEIRKALAILKEDDGSSSREENRTSMANKDKQMNMYFVMMQFFSLVIMCSHEPMLYCNAHPNWPTEKCDESAELLFRYSVFSMLSMVMHWLVIIDMVVLNTEMAAFWLVVVNVLGEVKQFLTALLFLILLFSSAITILCNHCTDGGGDFNEIQRAIVALFAITVRLYQGDFRDMIEDQVLLVSVLIFVLLSSVLLMNLLVAQLNLSYEFIYRDMLGFARLNRASLIVGAMQQCSTKRWKQFSLGLDLGTKLEFDKGDVGLGGCIQFLEPSGRHRINTEMIKRFGGTTNPEEPWPEEADEEEHDENDRFDRLEGLVVKATKSIVMDVNSANRLSATGGYDPAANPSSAGSSERSDASSQRD